MRGLLLLLPLTALGLMWWRGRMLFRELPWERTVLRSCVLGGTWTVAVTEGLSLVHALTPLGLAIAWLLACAALALDIARVGPDPSVLLPFSLKRLRGREYWALAVVLGILGLTGIVAWFAPPQTWDSLNYHMSRVAHWAQNESVEPFATGIETQNSRTPGAEFAVLHAYILAGSDRWVNLVAWGGVLGMTVAAWALSRRAGAGREGRLLSAVYVVSMPMAIVQASSTMTDSVAALWVAVVAVEVICLGDGESLSGGAVWMGLAAGLALLAKPTTLPYLAPLAVWACFRMVGREGWKRMLVAGLLAASLSTAVNAGHWIRSYRLYGDVFSGGDQMEVHANQALGLDGQISNVLRNLALQLGTPSPHVNRAIAYSIAQVHRLLGISPNDPRTTAHGYFKVEVPMTRENTAANPVQAYVGLFALGAAFARRDSSPTLKRLSGAAIAGFWLFSTLFKWQIFGSRYQLVFFSLVAPAAGLALAGWGRGRWSAWIAGAMTVLALPWLLSIRSRPLLPIPGNALVGSVLTESRETLLLANAAYLRTPYLEMTRRIREAGCRDVGLALGGNSAEYPLWSFLGFPETDRHIEWLVAGSPSSGLVPASFHPCAVICEGCERDRIYRGLPRDYAMSGYVLFRRLSP